jgi:23S rRNA (adenine2503-C2)-methyltransferase
LRFDERAVTGSITLPDVAEFDRAELETWLERHEIRAFHGRQIFQWIYRRGVTDFGAMTDLARPLRGRLSAELGVTTPRVARRERSTDGTEKFLLALGDGRHIESVFIPDSPANTFCLSTQVGCAMRCAFCLTGRMGLVRHLTAGEIAGQVRVLAGSLHLLADRFNIVLMGMGEPLHNYDQTMKALRILADPSGFAIAPRRITLSTVGIVPALDRLAGEPLMPNLAVSLHATTDEVRARLVPTSRAYTIGEVIDACRRFPLKRRARITFEYVLLEGVNDTGDDARRLVTLLAGLKVKVNLIPLNEAPGIPFARPTEVKVSAFAAILADHGVTVSVRKSRGRDIRAACGQLIVDGLRRSPAQRAADAMC